MLNNNFSSPPTAGRRGSQEKMYDLSVWRERFILTILRAASVFGIGLLVVTFPTSTARDRILYIILYLALLAVTILPATYTVRAGTLLFLNFVVGINAILAWGPWADGSIFLLAGITLSSLLMDRRIDILALVTSTLFTLTIAILQQTGSFHFSSANAPATGIEDWAGYILDFSIAGIVIVVAIGQFKDVFMRMILDLQNSLNALSAEKKQMREHIRERTEELETRMAQVRTSASAARAIAETQNISELLETAVNLISEKFGYYHVGLLVLDEQGKSAFLQAASSETGRKLIGQAFHIGTDKKNPLNFAAQYNRPSITSDIEQAAFLRDENFPLTRSRMVLPLAVRGKALGLLDIHADQPRAFTAEDAEILQTVADLTAISFDNTRLTNETQSLLSQLEANTSIQTQRTWSKLARRHKPSYQYTPAGVRPIFTSDKSDDSSGLHIPLVLHGQTIGRIKLKRKGAAAGWSERERNLLEKIADQIALSLENSRLVDEAQRNALRDQMIANISTRVRETLDIESVIRSAAAEMRRVFDLKEAEITVGAPGVPGDGKSSVR